jgi:hypothetical protein
MPTGFQFRDRSGRSINLSEIDRKMCCVYGMEPDEKYFSPMLQTFLKVAITLVANNGAGIMTETLLEDYRKKNPEIEPAHMEVLKSFFIKNYIFTAWPEDK